MDKEESQSWHADGSCGMSKGPLLVDAKCNISQAATEVRQK